MPRIEQTIADLNVRSHTFRFIAPAEAEGLKMPNSCNTCHTDKSVAWATEGVKGLDERLSGASGIRPGHRRFVCPLPASEPENPVPSASMRKHKPESLPHNRGAVPIE
jgi:hypothetical protein